MAEWELYEPKMNDLWCPYWFWEATIPSFICDQIVDVFTKQGGEYQEGRISDTGEIVDGFRKSDIKFSYESWINCMLYGYVCSANAQNFGYKLSGTDKEGFQFTRYGVGDYYSLHRDFSIARNAPSHTRKLSVTVQLSDPNTYEGGDLLMEMCAYDDDPEDRRKDHKITRGKGSIIVFDSRLPHEVTPVTKGTRYSLVKWVHGDTPLQ
tara:strand:+ start:134 stop:757 length:624 start_codon:yes stop_codon:yes gene_type:complete